MQSLSKKKSLHCLKNKNKPIIKPHTFEHKKVHCHNPLIVIVFSRQRAESFCEKMENTMISTGYLTKKYETT